MTLYFPPSLQHFEPRHIVFSTWMDHLAFAYDLMEALRPDSFVELGTHGGLSYFAFCQSVQEHGLNTRCYAVDTWQGDSHTGEYEEEVYSSVANHNLAYADFSTLMRMTFAEALTHFEDNSLELIHLDGLHTYEAIHEDFNSWYPKLRPGGLMLFHDVAARMKDFGAWRFWDEKVREHETFTFYQGFGLGVLRKFTAEEKESRESSLLRMLFSRDPGGQQRLRQFYVHATHYLNMKRSEKQIERIRQRRQEQAEQQAGQSGHQQEKGTKP